MRVFCSKRIYLTTRHSLEGLNINVSYGGSGDPFSRPVRKWNVIESVNEANKVLDLRKNNIHLQGPFRVA